MNANLLLTHALGPHAFVGTDLICIFSLPTYFQMQQFLREDPPRIPKFIWHVEGVLYFIALSNALDSMFVWAKTRWSGLRAESGRTVINFVHLMGKLRQVMICGCIVARIVSLNHDEYLWQHRFFLVYQYGLSFSACLAAG